MTLAAFAPPTAWPENTVAAGGADGVARVCESGAAAAGVAAAGAGIPTSAALFIAPRLWLSCTLPPLTAPLGLSVIAPRATGIGTDGDCVFRGASVRIACGAGTLAVGATSDELRAVPTAAGAA